MPDTSPMAEDSGTETFEGKDALFTALYRRSLARRQLRRLPRGGTLDTTGLIHEAYLKLAGDLSTRKLSRGHFLCLASRAMRQIVIDAARRRGAAKRAGAPSALLPENPPPHPGASLEELVILDQALIQLERLDPRLARLVELRFFGGLSVEETAEAMGTSEATVKRDWRRARAFLVLQLKPASG